MSDELRAMVDDLRSKSEEIRETLQGISIRHPLYVELEMELDRLEDLLKIVEKNYL